MSHIRYWILETAMTRNLPRLIIESAREKAQKPGELNYLCQI